MYVGGGKINETGGALHLECRKQGEPMVRYTILRKKYNNINTLLISNKQNIDNLYST